MSELTGVLMAAGMGSRLLPFTADRPKVLVDIGGSTLLAWGVGFLRAAGCEKMAAIGGYHYQKFAEEAMRLVPDIQLVENTEYRLQNAVSLGKLLETVRGDLLLIDIDFVRSKRLANRVAGTREETTLYVVDGPPKEQDSMKIQFDQNRRLIDLSKTLETFDATSAGLFFLPEKRINEMKTAVKQAIDEKGAKEARLEDALRLLNHAAPVMTENVGEHDWAEVDTPEDKAAADAYVAEHRAELVEPAT